MLKAARLLALLISLVGGLEAADFSDCAENLATLENALYANGKNVLGMSRAFFPPGSDPPSFVTVNYNFLNATDEVDGCDVNYLWSNNAFLIFLPPTVFRFASLNFFYPESEFSNLTIFLPYECRPLVAPDNSSGSLDEDSCTCDDADQLLLNHFTQQMDIYAKFNSREAIVRQVTNSRAICSSRLEVGFYEQILDDVVEVFAVSSIAMPIIACCIVLYSFRNAHDTTKDLVKPENHPKLVGRAMTAFVVTLVIYIHDMLASARILKDLDYYRRVVSDHTPHFTFLHVTTALDSFFVLSLFLIWIYIIYCAIMQFFGFRRKLKFPPKVMSVVQLIVGKNNAKYLDRLSDNDVITFGVIYMLVPPVFMFTSHIGYIVAAWLINPHRATLTLLIHYALIAYFYWGFKKVHSFHAKVSVSTRPLIPIYSQVKASNTNAVAVALDKTSPPSQLTELDDSKAEAKNRSETGNEMEIETSDVDDDAKETSFKLCAKFYINYGKDSAFLNVQALVVAVFYGVILGCFAAMPLAVFVTIPSATENVFTYITNIFHILVILVTAQLSFKIFSAVNFTVENFLDVFRDRLTKKKETELNSAVLKVAKSEASTTEVAGVLAADIADAVINKVKKD